MIPRLRRRVREALLRRWGLPYSPIAGLPPCIFVHLRHLSSISLMDVGANRGAFAAAIARFRPLSRAILIEPIPRLAEQLRQWTGHGDVEVIEAVILDRLGSSDFHVFPNAPDMSSVLELDHGVGGMTALARGEAELLTASVKTLDLVAADCGVTRLDLLKLDIQGAEHLALQGGSKLLSVTDYVYTEVSFIPLYKGSCVFEDVHVLLRSAGFSLIALEPGFRNGAGELLQADALFRRRGG